MANMTKNVIIGALLAIVDLVVGFPFQGQMLMDIMFLVGAAMVGYMGWDSYRDLR